MLFWILPFLLLYGDKHWSLSDTDIYLPLLKSQVAISDDYYYFLDTQEQNIVRFTKHGEAYTFAVKGQGPGELAMAMTIQWVGSYLIVNDFPPKVYDEDGFVRNIKFPLDGFVPFVPHKEGFIYYQRDDALPEHKKNQLSIVDWNMQGQVILHSWSVQQNVLDYFEGRNGAKTILPSKVSSRSYCFTSKDLQTLFFNPAGSKKILIFDLKTKKQLKEINLEGDWRVGRVLVHPDNTVSVYCQGLNDNRSKQFTFTQEGEPTTPSLDLEQSSRIVAYRNGQAYILQRFADTETYGLIRCKKGQEQAFLATAGPYVVD